MQKRSCSPRCSQHKSPGQSRDPSRPLRRRSVPIAYEDRLVLPDVSGTPCQDNTCGVPPQSMSTAGCRKARRPGKDKGTRRGRSRWFGESNLYPGRVPFRHKARRLPPPKARGSPVRTAPAAAVRRAMASGDPANSLARIDTVTSRAVTTITILGVRGEPRPTDDTRGGGRGRERPGSIACWGVSEPCAIIGYQGGGDDRHADTGRA